MENETDATGQSVFVGLSALLGALTPEETPNAVVCHSPHSLGLTTPEEVAAYYAYLGTLGEVRVIGVPEETENERD